MIVDTSAILAVLGNEVDAAAYFNALRDSPKVRMSAATLLEASIVADSRGPGLGRRLDRLVAELDIEVMPVDRAQVDTARAAYREYGRGTGHPAALNFGDCFSYALAMQTGAPLLFKGNDFTHTDVRPARIEP